MGGRQFWTEFRNDGIRSVPWDHRMDVPVCAQRRARERRRWPGGKMRGCQVLEDDVPGMCRCHSGGGVLAPRPVEEMACNSVVVAGPSDCRARCEIECHDTSLTKVICCPLVSETHELSTGRSVTLEKDNTLRRCFTRRLGWICEIGTLFISTVR